MLFLQQKNMLIRKAQPNDITAILGLIKELAFFEKEPESVTITEADLLRDGFSELPLFKIFVAEIDTEIVGMALYYYRYSTWKGKTIHLEDLIVKQHKRNLGIGLALYAHVIKQAKIEGLQRVEWAVLDWNTNAIDFYRKRGATILDDWRIVQIDKKGIDNFLNKLNS